MFQWDAIVDVLDNPVVIRLIIGGAIFLIVVIICCIIHNKLIK